MPVVRAIPFSLVSSPPFATPNSTFDYGYYHHTPLVEARLSGFGFVKIELLRNIATLDGTPSAFELIALLTFTYVEDMQSAMAAHGAEINGDIPNLTNVQPMIQINQPL